MAKKKSTIFNEQQFFNRIMKSATAMFLHEAIYANKETGIEIMEDFFKYVRGKDFVNVERAKKYNSNFNLNSVNEVICDLNNFFVKYCLYIKNNPDRGIDNYKICEKFIKENFVSEINGTIDVDIVAHIIHRLHRSFYEEDFYCSEFMLRYGNMDSDNKKNIKDLMMMILQCSILIGVYIFVTVEKPKNNFVKNIKKAQTVGKLKYEYSSLKVLDQEEISLYKDGAGFYSAFQRFISKNKGAKFSEYVYTIIKISIDIYGEEEEFTGLWNVGELIPLDMPFVEIMGNSLDSISVVYKDEEITDNIIKFKREKKYAFPKEGCDVEIIEDGTYIKSMSIDYLDGEYIFKVILNEKWFDSDDGMPGQGVFVVPKLKIDDMRKNFNKNNWDESLFYYSNKSTTVVTEDDKKMITKLAINIFLMHTIYCIENEIENSQIIIRNKSIDDSRTRSIKTTLGYRTAIIEKENDDGISFYDKKYYAVDNDGSEKYIIDDGYIYVRECNIYYKEIMKRYIEI